VVETGRQRQDSCGVAVRLDVPAGDRFADPGLARQDTLVEQGANGQAVPYYRAQVRIVPAAPGAKLAGVELKPGMTASVDIRTDSRSILKYLAKPVFKAFGGAMNER